MSGARLCLVLLAIACAAPAQIRSPRHAPKEASPQPPELNGGELKEELMRLRLELQKAQADEERLLELRIRHDLGLSTDAAAHFAVGDAERAFAGEVGEKGLAAEQEKLKDLGTRLDELTHKVDGGKAQTTRPPAPGGEGQTPQLGKERGARRENPRVGRSDAKSRPQEPPPERGPASRASKKPERAPTLINGSMDHRSVGRILFLAGRFAEAKDELMLVASDPKTAELQDLFLLARCYEKLSDFALADDLYKRIEALDTKDDKSGKVTGAWALAARAAARQMTWIRENGKWKPPRSVESLDWKRQ